ncbi:hypothetical protein [Amycolatopsis sp. H20-H5]|uniref:hypothetical protein n=1 Tax=Amycolatopsis sp. H20-H5 TaxID=3046309 RepID=UPI002DBCEF41|nr:hypothetical protein [Amycolatopsis sp. H20-H5]MEC3981762.1 hypothetical protein [Amycolatopsis sp. H20-H5]
MADADRLDQLFDAWREDIESVPFPQFSELLIPAQKSRARLDPASVGRLIDSIPRSLPMSNVTPWRDA